MPAPNDAEMAAGAKKYAMSEDLTTPTYRKYRSLLEDERVEKAWTRSGEVWVVRKGENQRPILVKSVYDSNDQILG